MAEVCLCGPFRRVCQYPVPEFFSRLVFLPCLCCLLSSLALLIFCSLFPCIFLPMCLMVKAVDGLLVVKAVVGLLVVKVVVGLVVVKSVVGGKSSCWPLAFWALWRLFEP